MATSASPATIGTHGSGDRRRPYARGEGDRLRQDLLDAAADLMARHDSIERVSLRAVARAAGVSPTAVYRHFDDHLDLLREAVEYCWTNFHAVIKAGQNSSDDPFVAFRNTGNAYVDFAMRHRGQYRVLFSNRIDVGMENSDVGRSAFRILVDEIAAMLEANDDDRDPALVAMQTHTWMHGIVDLCGGNPDMPWPDTATMLDGLAAALRLTPGDRGNATR